MFVTCFLTLFSFVLDLLFYMFFSKCENSLMAFVLTFILATTGDKSVKLPNVKNKNIVK